MEFEWDQSKAAANLKKHFVSFQEAATVFGDPLSLSFDDPDHSIVEERFITVGRTLLNRIVIVAHLDSDNSIRIISARQATPKEIRDYESEE